MKEKLWSSIVRIIHGNKISTRDLVENINEKINENFITQVIIQNTNEISKHAAAALWWTLEPNKMKTRQEYNQTDIQSQQCHISRILKIFCGDAASPTGDAAPALGRCDLLPLEMYYLFERCTFPMRDAASPECGCCVSLWRCGISTGDLQNSGYVILLTSCNNFRLWTIFIHFVKCLHCISIVDVIFSIFIDIFCIRCM